MAIATPRNERRLAAILAADIVGYSRLIEEDEAATLAAIRDLRSRLVDPLLAGHRGRIVKLMGDGAIVEFGSVVDAAACAVAVQKAITEGQAQSPPDRRIVFRMGVNLGDVVVDGDDLLGDGVNVAARLDQLAEPGGVLVSGTATIICTAGSVCPWTMRASSGSRASPVRRAPTACGRTGGRAGPRYPGAG